MSVKKSFVLYCDYRDHIQLLNDVERGQLFTALFDYVGDGKESDLPPMAKMAFSFIKSQLDRDSEKYEQKVNKRKEAGKKGGIAKAQNIAKLANASFATNSLANLADNGTVNDTVTDNANETSLSRAPRGGMVLDSGFEKFWSAYPKKNAKAQAVKAWQKLKPDDELVRKILAALEQHKRSAQWLKENGQFIPYPATWLNGKRWEDDLPQAAGNSASGWSDKPLSEEEKQAMINDFFN